MISVSINFYEYVEKKRRKFEWLIVYVASIGLHIGQEWGTFELMGVSVGGLRLSKILTFLLWNELNLH